MVKASPPNAECVDSIPDQGARSHKPQSNVHMPQIRPGAANTYFFFK